MRSFGNSLAVLWLLTLGGQLTPPLKWGEPFRVTFDHTIKWVQPAPVATDPMVPCTVTPPAAPCVADTTHYELRIDGVLVETIAATVREFAVASGLPAGPHSVVVTAIGPGGPATAKSVDLTVDLGPPGTQAAPTVARTAPPPPWLELITLRATSSPQSQRDSASLAFVGTVPAGLQVIVGGAAWVASAAPAAVTVTGSGTACAGLTFTTRVGGAPPTGVTWRTFLARARTTTAGSCTITVNPAGTASDFSWTQTGFTGPETVLETTADCTGGTAAPSCPLAGHALVVGVVSHNAGTMTITVAAGTTAIGELEQNSDAQAHALAYSKAASVGWTLATGAPWSVQVLGLR